MKPRERIRAVAGRFCSKWRSNYKYNVHTSMINWRKKLQISEDNNDWQEAIGIYNCFSSPNMSEKEHIEFDIRLMFIISSCLLEGEYSEIQYLCGKRILKKIYLSSYNKYKNDADYLFCLAVIMRLNEDIFDINLSVPDILFKKAIDLSPSVDLYLFWNIRYGHNVVNNRKYLFSKFVNNWRENKGLLGKYVVDYLRDKL